MYTAPVKPISSRTQLWLIAAGYAAVLVLAASLAIPRYLYEVQHRDEVVASGGMYAAGDLMLEVFIAGLFIIPTVFLVAVSAKFEGPYHAYSQILLGISLSAPVCLGLLFLGERYLGSTLDILCWYRLSWSPLILVLIGVSRFAARFARARKFLSYALLTEGLTLAVGIALLFLTPDNG